MRLETVAHSSRARGVAVLGLAGCLACGRAPLEQRPGGARASDASSCPESPLREAARREGRVRVIVRLKGAEDAADAAARGRQIAERQDRLMRELEGTGFEVLRRSDRYPTLALRVDEPALCRLLASALVDSVTQDTPDRPTGSD